MKKFEDMTVLEMKERIEDLEDEVSDLEKEISELQEEHHNRDRDMGVLYSAFPDQLSAAVRELRESLPDPVRETYEQGQFRRNLEIVLDTLQFLEKEISAQ